ncbi:helix-turn-helix domain-containing protein [Photobacterium nomapromontoriensis]|uniref:helix-turn-helix domain-containing protein n=1 Tax=Photobacterium nomapromontoriensis TaxID=2910237 RepID=UPI003D0AA7F7
MVNWLHSPHSSDIAKYVECYWFIEKKAGIESFPRLNPDPNGHLIIAPSDQPYQYDSANLSTKGHGSHWLFPHRQTYQMDHTQPFCLLGIKFRVGALYSLTVVPDQPVLDLVTPLNGGATFPLLGFNDGELIDSARYDVEVCWHKIETLLLPWLLNGQDDKHSSFTQKALPFLANTPISKIGAELHCSQRTLERSFSRVTGMTLKQCQSMQRLDAMLEYLYPLKGQDIDWSQVAYLFGFSDQPHLIRYLKNGLGLTPGEYAKQRNFTIDVYGGVESSQ